MSTETSITTAHAKGTGSPTRIRDRLMPAEAATTMQTLGTHIRYAHAKRAG